MARVTDELKKFTGTVGNLVFYQRNGISYVRTKPSAYRDAKTDSQLLARGRFSGCNRFYGLPEDKIFRKIWRIVAEGTGKNAKNWFFRYNMHAFGKDQEITDYGRLHFSAGLLPLPGNLSLVCNGGKTCLLQWKYDPQEALGSSADRLYIVELQEGFRPEIHETGICRHEGKAVFSTSHDINPKIHLYCFWGNEQGTSFSGTCYFGHIAPAEP